MHSAAREAGQRQLALARELLPRILADAATAGVKPVVELELDERLGLGFMDFYTPGRGSGRSGDAPDPAANAPELLAWLAENVQEVTMEGDQVHCRVWPVCSAHGLGGHAVVEAEVAVWWCNGDGGHLLAPVGELAGRRG